MIVPASQEKFPPLEAANHVTLDEFYTAFGKFSEKIEHRIFKLERLQYYSEADNESWREFQAGNIGRSLELQRVVRARDAEYDIKFFRRGLQFLRIRAVELPLTSYVEWELHAHAVSAQYGETILIANLNDSTRDGNLWNARDFLLFDSFAVLIHDYSADGTLRGGWVCQEKSIIAACTVLARQFTAVSIPLAVFMTAHPSPYGPHTA